MNFKIGAMTDSFKKSFRESLDKAVEVGAEGIQLYVTGGEMLYSNLDDAKLEEVKKTACRAEPRRLRCLRRFRRSRF